MSKRWLRGAVVVLIGMALSAGSVFADGRWHENRNWNRHEPRFERSAFRERRHEIRRERAREWRHDNNRNRRVWQHERRERHERMWRAEHRDDRQGHRPAGWDRGRKTGWSHSQLPPGQAKKADASFDQGHGADHRGR